MLAPILEVPATLNVPIFQIAAVVVKFPLFVVVILLKGLVWPTIPSTLRVPPLTVKLFAVEVLLFTVPVKLTVPDVTVEVMSALKVTGP